MNESSSQPHRQILTERVNRCSYLPCKPGSTRDFQTLPEFHQSALPATPPCCRKPPTPLALSDPLFCLRIAMLEHTWQETNANIPRWNRFSPSFPACPQVPHSRRPRTPFTFSELCPTHPQNHWHFLSPQSGLTAGQMRGNYWEAILQYGFHIHKAIRKLVLFNSKTVPL